MIGNYYFYNRTIRKIVVAFGSLFNQISVVRKNKGQTVQYEHFKVPLVYGSKEKYLTRLLSDPSLVKSIATNVPRISFEMTGLSYDSSRKQITTAQNFSRRTGNNTKTGVNAQYVPIPYNYDFSMSIYTRNTEDGAQILEQILPFFTPDYTVTVNYNSEMTQKYDLPIILNSVSNEVDYEGDMMNTRLIIWNLEFTAKGFVFPAIRNSEIIRMANTNTYIDNTLENVQTVLVDTANGHGSFSQNEIVRVQGLSEFGTVMKYDTSTNTGVSDTAYLYVAGMNKQLVNGDTLIGDKSNALRTVTSMDRVFTTPILASKLTTVPDPFDSEPDDEFGFSETLLQWPDTI